MRSNRSFYDGGTIPWVKTGELNDWYIEDTEEHITEEGLAHSSAKLFEPETVLMAMYGDGRTITSLGILRRPATSNQACCAMIADPKICHPLFLFYSLKAYRHVLLKLAYGGSQRNLNAKTIKEFAIPIPSLVTQECVVRVLSAYDHLIENNTRRIKILEEMAHMLYREWFVHFRFPGHEKVRMVQSELGPIPEGWTVTSFDSLSEVLSGGTPKTSEPAYWDGSIPFFGPTDAPDAFFVLSTTRRVTELGLSKCNSKLYPAETVFITARGTVGKVALPACEMAMNQSCYALKGKQGVNQLALFLMTKHLAEQLKKKATGAVFDTITVDTFQKLRVVRSVDELLARLESEVRPIFALLLNLLRRNANLRTTRDLLLPKLISGEIPVDAAEETATELQEEIALHA
ncbi:MAG: restriction endonuclease subunit S [Bryobacter sp.]|nr:restriction endonuclease subunit S [Bryobacter sp. CoA8 C33]